MSLVCAISNEIPEAPVVSPASGNIFERRLIEKYIAENGDKDPINGEQLTMEMLIDIKVQPFVKARPPTSTSIPGILKSLQDEWDAAMLNSFTLRQQLITARQELSHAMYQHDAACRVIARLSKEVTAAREALVTLKPQQGVRINSENTQSGPGTMQTLGEATSNEVVGVSTEVLQKLQDTAAILTQERKKRGKNVPDGLVSSDNIKDFQVIASHTGLHSASVPGILSLDLVGDTVVTGGKDKVVVVFNKRSEQVVSTLKGHTNKVMVVACHPSENIIISGSMDNTVRIWNSEKSQLLQTLKIHDGSVTGLSLHATGDYLLSTSLDQHWAFSDIQTGAVLAKVCGDNENALTSARFHPDGLIFATGTLSGQIRIWDLKEQTNVANFSGHVGPITGISFSENGYYLATAAEDSSVKLWDLRKLKNFKTIEMADGFNITDLAFDQSGSYLAFTGNDVRVYGCKVWNEIAVFAEHTAMGTGVRFGSNASFLVSSSMDRTLKFYSSPEYWK